MEPLLQHDRALQSHPAPGSIFFRKKFNGTKRNGAEGALPIPTVPANGCPCLYTTEAIHLPLLIYVYKHL